MAVKRKAYVKLQCKECKSFNYYAHKSKQLIEKKLEVKKFCKKCRKHALHKEVKR